MLRRADLLLVLAASLLTASCRTSEIPSDPLSAAAAEPSDELLELVRFGNRVRALEGGELAEQYRSLAFGDAFWSNDSAIRLSLLLSAPSSPYHDVDQAARLLRDVVERGPEPAAAGQEDLAQLLHHLLSERVYAASADENLAGLLSEARNRNERLSEELETLQDELSAERERRETLERQLDALRRLEEQLSLESTVPP